MLKSSRIKTKPVLNLNKNVPNRQHWWIVYQERFPKNILINVGLSMPAYKTRGLNVGKCPPPAIVIFRGK